MYLPFFTVETFLLSSNVQLKYVNDDSTMFWAVGYDNGVIAKHAEFCGQEVEMVVPFEGVSSGEVYILNVQVCLCIIMH